MRHVGCAFLAVCFVLVTIAGAAPAAELADDEDGGGAAATWITVAEAGTWPLADGRHIDLSQGWKVIRHRESGVHRLQPNAYGTQNLTIEQLPFWSFAPANFGENWNGDSEDGYGWRLDALATLSVAAPLQVPSGLRVEIIEVEACDSTATLSLEIVFQRCAAGTTICEPLSNHSVSTGVAFDEGCSFFSAVPGDSGVTIENLFNTYHLKAISYADSSALKLRTVRVYLRRQVSPAPGSATFDDVPTGHLFFQHIEALAASGITAGCGGGDFCPNDPLTRGQMAAFLAKALGLHWLN